MNSGLTESASLDRAHPCAMVQPAHHKQLNQLIDCTTEEGERENWNE